MRGLPGQDAELVVRAREGDLDAFERLVARHRTRVVQIARQIVGDREAAQDIAQEALVRAFRALPSLRDEERFGPWLNTITRRVGAQWLRHDDHRPEPMDSELVRGMPVLWGSPPGPPTELVERVRAALAVLSQRERRAMILHYLEGRSCEEIAARLGVSNGSVRLILHHSRRKARKEADAMAEAARERKGPRELGVWVDGYPGPARGNVFYHLNSSLPQTICLAVNKRPKTVPQLADEAEAHPRYVQEVVNDLLEMEVLTSPAKDQYLTNFIAFEAEDWRRLMKLVPEPAGASAKRLAAAEPRLRKAFECTPLAKLGWTWEDLIWPMYASVVCNMGGSRVMPEAYRPPKPERPGGGRYWLGGIEVAPDVPGKWWLLPFHCNQSPGGLGNGYLPLRVFNRKNPPYIEPVSDQATVVEALAGGPLTEADLLAKLGGDAEHWRGMLAELVSIGYVARANGRYKLTIPVFMQGDSDVLAPEVEAVMKPVIDEVVVPALSGLPAQLKKMGYEHRRDQFGQWQRWIAGSIMAEAVHFLLEQGVLPRPPDPAPASFAFIAWKGDLTLTSWGV
jgi:RNA polymerase sigma-70 factor (ECF subfamily)